MTNIFKYIGKSVINPEKRGYVSLTNRWRTFKWFLNEGHVLAHAWDRFKWYNCPRFFVVPNYPCHLELEASAACQMKCPMCAQGKMFEKGLVLGNLNMDLFKRTIDEIHDKVYSIKLSWRGEPSLNPHLHDMIRYAKLEKKMKSVAFLTNFELYDEAMIDDLLTTGVDYVSISFDGMKEVYEKIRHPAKFEETIEKVKYLKKKRDELGLKTPNIRVQSIFSAIQDNPQEYFDLWEPIADKVNYISDQWRASLDPKDYDLDPDYVCPTPFNRMAVGWDGKVFLCKSDYSEGVVLGDLNKETVHKIWHNKKFGALRDAMKNGTRLKFFSPCMFCTDGARAESGDYISVDGRKLPVRINAGRKVKAKELDGSTNRWKRGKRKKSTAA
jgi:hypothetical protein